MEPIQLIIEQGKNVLESMKELKRVAHKKGNNRTSLIQRFTANKHSFQVYTYMDASIRDSEQVKVFLEQLQFFSDAFEPARYEIDGEVELDQAEATYQKVHEAYNELVTTFGHPEEVIKRF